MWIDSHCHLDAAEFDTDRDAVRQAAREAGVTRCLIPAVARANFDAVRELAHRYDDWYALGIHPLYVPNAQVSDLDVLASYLQKDKTDKKLVAVGEIGLDYFVPSLCTDEMRKKQWHFYVAQLKLAKSYSLPVVLHVRRSADMLIKGLRQTKFECGGIAHAFNGSLQQAQAFIQLGFKLGFGGTLTYERALQIRRLTTELPLESLVLETDAPDIAPKWLYVTQAQRSSGALMNRNSPLELPKIAHEMAKLRAISVQELASCTSGNVRQVLSVS